jgi:hypothetical protein
VARINAGLFRSVILICFLFLRSRRCEIRVDITQPLERHGFLLTVTHLAVHQGASRALVKCKASSTEYDLDLVVRRMRLKQPNHNAMVYISCKNVT